MNSNRNLDKLLRVIFPEVLMEYFDISGWHDGSDKIEVWLDEKHYLERSDYPLSVFVCRGYELGYELCLLGAKRCTLRQTQGDKKVPQIIEFVGLDCSLPGFVRIVQRRDRERLTLRFLTHYQHLT